MTIVDEVDDTAKKIGAISCIVVREDGSLFGTNNDWLGFLGNLKHQQPDWRADAGPCTVIGAGGGGRAVIYGLLARRRQGITAGEPDPGKSREDRRGIWRTDHRLPLGRTPCAARRRDDSRQCHQSRHGWRSALDINLDKLSPTALAADIIYTPLESPFLAAAAERQNKTVNGLGMLLFQGPPAWKRWFGVEPTVTDELRAIMEKSILAD